nr:hypothetical protein [Tanacetum cinerariifolium]
MCSFTRKLKEDLVSYLKYFHDTFESSNDSTNVVNAPREPFVVKKDHGVNPSQIDKCCCECGNALDGIFCQQCICKSCGKGAHIVYNCPPKVPIISNPEPCNPTINNKPPRTLPGFDPTCYSNKENSAPCVSKPNFVDESSNIFNPPPQPPINSCEFCGSNAQYGHYCTPQAQFNNLEQGYSQDFNFPQYIYNFQQHYFCCDQCGCQPLKYTVDHPIFDAHNDFLKSQNELSIAQNTIMEQMTQLTSMCELVCQIVQKKQEEKRIEEEKAANARYWKIPIHRVFHNKSFVVKIAGLLIKLTNITAYCDDDDDYDSAITPILSTEEPVDSLSMGGEHLDTISATESDEVIKSSVEDLVRIPSEFKGIPDTMCDVHFVNSPTPLEAKDHVEIVINSNDDIFSSDDDSLHEENIEYVEASPHDSELVSLEAAEIVIPEVKEIEDDNLREKLFNVHLLIANIEALKDNPTPSSELLTKSSSTSLNSFLEETNTFHNSLPEFENFYFDLGEISSGSTTTHSDIFLPDYEAFYFNNDNIKVISSGSTTTHSDISLSEYDSFIFDLTHEEFADELA